ncbi:hypothetical protein NC77_26700 [Janthinobacterium lividum]|nr:hypothetical protein NC77_26700 [Janthinobacterium lividum]
MIVPMMNVRIMGGRMAQRHMMICMAIPTVVMRVLMVRFVAVCMRVEQQFVLVIVLMLFRQMQPDARCNPWWRSCLPASPSRR